MTEAIQGQLERITFHNDETGYTVAQIRLDKPRKIITAVGRMTSPQPGEILTLTGDWINHPQFGRQFGFTNYSTAVPTSISGIEKYLASGLIQGIGPVMAKRLVAAFGQKTLDVIENQSERLHDVEGIGPKRVDMIRQAWQDQKAIRHVMLFLQDHGVGVGFASKIYKKYGDDSIRLIQENPYRLAEDIYGIGFLRADRIAASLGLKPDSPVRLQAGIVHVLQELSSDGHVYYLLGPLREAAAKLLDADPSLVDGAIRQLAVDRRVVIEDASLTNGSLSVEQQAVYLAGYHHAENSTARHLSRISCGSRPPISIRSDQALEWVQQKLSIQLAERQIEAVKRAITEKILVVTGGPGTGKTTIIQSILAIYAAKGARILLAAPTGRAAKRMTETTGREAKTIHRLLEYSPQDGGFKRDHARVLECDLLVVDEASMIDQSLAYYLFRAVPDSAVLILVGDVDQLPSVGPGNVLKDIISSERVTVVRLNEIFRQARESQIVVNAHRINEGKMPLPSPEGDDALTDFYFIERRTPEDTLKTILDLMIRRIPSRFGFNSVDDIQVLSPMHRGAAGTDSLNEEIQKAFNPNAESVTRHGVAYGIGDKVMQVRNNYDKGVYNGDIGRIVELDVDAQQLVIRYDQTDVAYHFTELDEIALAYAATVHKSQGSEYPAVILPILTQHHILLQRNLVYTAVTRGRKLVVLVGSQKALASAIRNNRPTLRNTKLAERLREQIT